MMADFSLGCLAVLWLVAPGWWMARMRGLTLPACAGFIFGVLALFALIEVFTATHLALSLKNLQIGWGLISLLALLTHRTRGAPGSKKPALIFRLRDAVLLLPVIPAIAVVAYRACVQPLSGVDTVFRWNFLAEQMLERRTLDFYPPVTGADYAIYAWPDGIAPVVSSLYFWVYSFAGQARPGLTAPLVIAQLGILLLAIYHLGKRFVSSEAAGLGCVLAACSPILLWGVAMGQESGLLALSLVGLLLYFPGSPSRNEVGEESSPLPGAFAAGMAAALGGLAREYGLAFIVLGLGLGLTRRLSWRVLVSFALMAILCAGPWYLRNAARTGNPLFNLNLAGLFPVNTAHENLMRVYQDAFGWAHLPREASRNLFVNCIAAFISAIGGLFCVRSTRVLWAAVLLVIGLWLTSIGYTSAGFTYSLRVLAPGLAVVAVIGGIAWARLLEKPAFRYAACFGCFLLSLDSAVRVLTLPVNAYKIPAAQWPTIGGAVHDYHGRPVYRQIADFAAGRTILTLGPAALLNRQGAHTVPPWSPDVLFLWDPSLTDGQIARKLRTQGVFLVLVGKNELNTRYLSPSPFFKVTPSPFLQLVWEDEDMSLFKVVDQEESFPAKARP